MRAMRSVICTIYSIYSVGRLLMALMSQRRIVSTTSLSLSSHLMSTFLSDSHFKIYWNDELKVKDDIHPYNLYIHVKVNCCSFWFVSNVH